MYALYFGAASLLGKRGGGRKWALIIDFVLGAGSSALAAPWPRGHVRNLLGGEPVVDSLSSERVARAGRDWRRVRDAECAREPRSSRRRSLATEHGRHSADCTAGQSRPVLGIERRGHTNRVATSLPHARLQMRVRGRTMTTEKGSGMISSNKESRLQMTSARNIICCAALALSCGPVMPAESLASQQAAVVSCTEQLWAVPTGNWDYLADVSGDGKSDAISRQWRWQYPFQ